MSGGMRFGKVGDDAQQALAAAARELPPPELTHRMAAGLGLSAGVVTAATAHAAASAKVTAGASVLSVPVVSAGVVVLAVAGAIVGVRWAGRPDAGKRAPAPAIVAASAPAAVADDKTVAAPVAVPAAAIDERPAAEKPNAPAGRKHAKLAPARNDFQIEIALVDAARAAALAHDDLRVLSLLDTYDAKFPAGTFQIETTALRIEALARLGRTAKANALANKFLAAHPDSVLGDRVKRAVTVAPR